MGLRWTEEDLERYLCARGIEAKTPLTSACVELVDSLNRALENAGKAPEPSEDEEQIALFEWAALNMGKYPALALMFHIPNGGGRSRAEAGRFKAMGVKAGVPDIFLPQPCGGFHGLFIELKRAHGGRVSREQQDWIDDLNARGYAAAVCHGWEEAAREIKEYLKKGG